MSHATRWFDVEGGRFPRIATTAHVVVGTTEVSFTSTHLDETSGPRRRASVEQLLAWLTDADGPHVVVGDFNATLDDSMFELFAAAGFSSALPPDAPGTSHHFTGRYDGRRIDHIFVPGTAEVLEAAVVHVRPNGRLASDHWPVARPDQPVTNRLDPVDVGVGLRADVFWRQQEAKRVSHRFPSARGEGHGARRRRRRDDASHREGDVDPARLRLRRGG